MKILMLFLILTTIACKKEEIKNMNPLGRVTDAIEAIDPLPEDMDELKVNYIKLMNEHRIGYGLAPLILSEAMNQVALMHGQSMASGSVGFGHQDSSSRCLKIREALGASNLCGENIARGQSSANVVLNSWLSSYGHRQKIESSRYTHTGLGIVSSPSGKIYWTQIFLEVY